MHAVTFHAVDTQMKSMHKQGVGERSEPTPCTIYIYTTLPVYKNKLINQVQFTTAVIIL